MASPVIPWSEVQSNPQFSSLTPDKKLEALNRWKEATVGQLDTEEDKDILLAGADLESRKIMGEEVPSLQEYLPEYRARKAADQQGILTQFGGALKTGLSDVTTGLGVTFDAATGDNAELAQGLEAMNATDAIRQQNKTTRDIELEKAFAENAKQFKEAKGFWPSAKELIDYVGIAATNPVAMTKMALESAPNALISIGATTAGAVGGTLLAGPAGGVAAASAAGSAANIPMEIPGAIRQKLLEATGGQAANWNASQIKDYLDANPQVKEEGLQKGLVRGAAIGVVEGLTAGLAGKVATIPERAAQKAVLADVARQLGKEVASPVDVADFIRAGGKKAQDRLAGVAADALSRYSKVQKAGMFAGAAGIETAGEGLGELSAQVASGEEISPTDVFVEMAAGGVLSGLSTAGARLASLPGKIVNADPELRQQAQDIQNAEGLAQQAASNENASAAAAAAKAVINEATSNMEEKAAVMLNDVSSGLEDLGTVEGDLLARVPLAKPRGGEISAPETVLEGQNYEQGPPTPEPQPETTPVRPEEKAVLEAVPARTGPVVPSEPGLPVLPEQPPAQAPQTDVGGGVASGAGMTQRDASKTKMKKMVVFRENIPGKSPKKVTVKVPVVIDPEFGVEVLTPEAERIIDEAKWPDTPASPFHADYAKMDYEGYFGVWGDESSRDQTRQNYRTLMMRAAASRKPVSFEGWKFDIREPLPEGYVRQGDLYVFAPEAPTKTPTPENNAPLQRQVPENRVEERVQTDEGGVQATPGRGNQPQGGGQVKTKGEEVLTDVTIPPQGVVPTASLPEGQPTPGGVGISPSRKKPTTVAEAEARIQEQQAASDFLGDLRAEQAQESLRAKKGRFISENAATQRESIFLADLLRGGWDKSLEDVQSGRVAPERASTLANAALSSGLIDGYTAGRFQFQPPQVSPSVREALRVEVESLPEVGRAKWTPDVVASAEDYIQNGTQDSYAKLNKTQKNLANRLRQQLGIQDEQDLQEAEMEKQMKEESKTRGSPYRNQIEQSADIPTAKVVSAVSEADFEQGLKVVEELIRNARATVISDSLDNLLSRSDITEEEKAALRKGAQGIYSNGRAIIARDNIKQTVLHTTPSQAAAAVIFHELMHKGSDILRNDPRLAESYAEWRSMLDENVTDDMLDAMVRRRGYTAWSDWRTNPTSKLRAQEEIFVRQMEDFFNRKGDLLAQEQTVFTRFLSWIKGLVEKVLGTPIEGRFKDAILEDWGRKFIKAVQTSNSVSADIAMSMAEQDAEYMAAVAAGDMEKAQKMVDEAVKKVGIGKPRPVSNADFLTANVFWRLQHPGQKLNPDFKSSSQNDPTYKELGLSVWGSLQELMKNQSGGLADYPRGEVEVVAIFGKRVGVGLDGEPVIKPIAEAARFRHPNLDDFLRSETLYSAKEMAENADELESIDEFLNEPWGWTRVPELDMEFDPVTYDDAGNVIPLSQRFNPETPDIRMSIETPGKPRTGTDRIATFSPEEREELANFMNGDTSFNKLKQFLGIEKAGELGRVEAIQPLKMAALDIIGFTEDKAGSPNVSKTATQNAYDIAEKLLAPGSKFGATYQQEVGGAESAATAVLQMELLRYALALSRKGDSRLLAMLRKNWNSIVLGTYITATSAGRILGVRSNYVSDVLRTIEAMDKEMLKAAAKKVQQDGVDPENAESFVRNLDEVVRQAEMDYAELEKLLNQKPYSVPSVDPYAWIERAVGKIDEEDQTLVNQLFRDLAFLDKAEARKAEFAKAANAPEASFLDDIYNEEVVLPDSPEELDEVIASTKKRISETLKKLTGKPKAAKAVKEKLPKEGKQLDEVESFIKAYEEKLKTPPAKKTTQPEMTLARLVRNQVMVPLERSDFAAQAARFGATEEQANRLFDRAVVEASLLTAEKGKPVTKFTKLIKYIQGVPALMNDPEGRSAAIESFLRDNGYTDEQIKQTQAVIEPVIREQIIKAKQNSLDKAIAAARKKAEQKLTPVEKNLGNKIGALSEQSFKLLESDLKKIRIGLGDREADPSQTLAAELGFTGFRPTDYQALSELDIKITEAAREGRPHDMAKGLRELYELLGRRRAPKTLMEVLAVAYNNSALSSVGTLAINVVAPSGSMATRVALDLGRAAATGNFKQAADILNAVVDSFKRTIKEAEYGLIGGASTVAMNQQVQRVTSLQRDFNEALSVFTQKGANTPEKRKGRGLPPKPTPTEYLKASYTAALATTDIVRRILATTDHVWSSVMQNYFLKTQAIKVLDTRVPKEVYMPALFNVSATVSHNLAYELATISDFAALMGDLKTAGKFDKDNLLEHTQTGAAEGLSSEAVSFDRDFKASLRRVITAYDTPASIEKHLLRELGRQRNEAYLRSNDRMKVEVLNFLEEKVPGSAKGVEKFIANESDYELGTHQGEEAPVADFMNTFTNMVREAGKSITARNPVLGRMIVGYFGVPANLLNRAMWFTPYGIYRYYLGSRARKDKVTASQFYQQSMETQAQINQRLVEALAGTAGIAMLMLLKGYDDDDEGFNVTLSGPENKTEKDAWRKLGHRQGSLEWVSEDGTVTSLNWARGPLEPLKIALLMVGAMDDMRLNRKLGDGVLGMSISDYLSSMLYGWSKQAVFFGAKSTIGAVAAPEPDASMLSSALYKVGPVVPYSGVISSVEKFISGPDRFYGREGSIYLNLPIARSLLTERAVNALGDPQGLVPSSAWSSLNDRAWYAGLPLMVSGPPTGNDKQVYDFILRRGTGPGLPQRAALENANGLMDDSKWLEYVATRGRILKGMMVRNLSRLNRMDDEGLSKALGEISSDATRIAKRQLRYK